MSKFYRPEIDGLRGIAVLGVVFYHARHGLGHLLLVPGGYVGVDVFFVISGYLISRIVWGDIVAGDFSFKSFYARRIRRILPALFFVMLATLPIAWRYMLPDAMLAYSRSAISALFSVSNLWFLSEDSYTAPAGELKPLLHTWSLSVEEQFYLIFPAMLLVLWRFLRRWVTPTIILLALASLVVAQIVTVVAPDTSFYILPTRMWELMAGALLAFWERSHPGLSGRGGKHWPAIGLTMILFSLVLFHDGVPHPSLITAIPVAGAMLVIGCSGQGSLAVRVLSSWPLRNLGLVSYSFYLWHYPVLVTGRFRFGGDLSILESFGLIGLSLGMAVVTYFVIERPFRNKSSIGAPALTISICGVSIILLAANAYLLASDGRAGRLGPVADLFNNAQRIEVFQDGRNCHGRPLDDVCRFDFGVGDRAIILIGDSHAAALANGLFLMAHERRLDYMQLTRGGCPYAPGLLRFDGADRRLRGECSEYSEAVRDILLSAKPSIVVISARFPLYLSGERFNNGEGGRERGGPSILAIDDSGRVGASEVTDRIQESIVELLDRGHTVVLIYPVPEAGWDIPQEVYANSDRLNLAGGAAPLANFDLTTSLDRFRVRAASSYEMLDDLGDRLDLLRVYPEDVLCDGRRGACMTHNDTALFYADDDHLSPFAAHLVLDEMEKALFGDAGWQRAD